MIPVIGQDALIEPNVVFGPGVTVEGGAVVHAFSHLEGAHVSAGATVGRPFARLRPGAIWARIPRSAISARSRRARSARAQRSII